LEGYEQYFVNPITAYSDDVSANILLEYADLGSLESYLKNQPPPKTPKESLTFWNSFRKLFDAIQWMHKGSKHREEYELCKG
jgi:hypothetical protein